MASLPHKAAKGSIDCEMVRIDLQSLPPPPAVSRLCWPRTIVGRHLAICMFPCQNTDHRATDEGLADAGGFGAQITGFVAERMFLDLLRDTKNAVSNKRVVASGKQTKSRRVASGRKRIDNCLHLVFESRSAMQKTSKGAPATGLATQLSMLYH